MAGETMGKNNYIDRLKLPDVAEAAEVVGLPYNQLWKLL